MHAVVGVQAQATRPASLAVRVRTAGLTAGDVAQATAAPVPGVVRTWVMRGTLHMVTAADLPWLVSLLGPTTIKAGTRRRRELGLTDAICQRALEVLPDVLDGPLSRADLVDRLIDSGVDVARSGQAPPHLLMYAASSGLICRGPDLGGAEPSYVLVDRWLGAVTHPSAEDRDASLHELAKRYLAGYGPAGVHDFAAWSGLPMSDARAAYGSLGDVAERIDSTMGELVALGDSLDGADASAAPRLLGAFDTLMLGYRGRDLFVAPEESKKVQAGGGMIAPTVLVDGQVVGTWRATRAGRGTTVTVTPFDSLSRGSRAALERDAEDLGRFLSQPVSLVVGSSR